MASTQCFKTADQTYNYSQDQCYESHSSLVNTHSQRTSKTETYYPDNGLTETQTTQFYSQTQTSHPSQYGHSHSKTHGHGHGLTQTHSSTHGHGHGLTQTLGLGHTSSRNGLAASGCNRNQKKGREHKRGLFERIKDGLSGGDNSCSSSDSESDDEHCERRKSY